MAGTPAAVGHDGAGGLHHRLPVGACEACYKHFAGTEIIQVPGAGDHPYRADTDLFADRLAADQHPAFTGQRVALERIAGALRRDRFRPRLHNIQPAVLSILRPFDVHRHGMAGLRGIVLLDADRVVGQRQHVGIVDAELRACRLGHDLVARRRADMAFGQPQGELLLTQRASQHGAMTSSGRSACAHRTRPDRPCPARHSRRDRRRQ